MYTDYDELTDIARDAMRALAREREQVIEKVEKTNALLKMIKNMEGILAEYESLKEENARLCDCLAKKKATFPEIHNHFEAGSSAQVFNDKVYREN